MILSDLPGSGPPEQRVDYQIEPAAAEDDKTRLEVATENLLDAQNAVLNLESNLGTMVSDLVGPIPEVDEEVVAKPEDGGLLGTVSAVSNDIMVSVSRMTDKLASLR